ncbi:hypothetical protein HPSSW114_1607 [Glaesserella parasuis SW114]|nr:hypothetical protein HPSSW114_1607 [Glaesserella parasuis SW114]
MGEVPPQAGMGDINYAPVGFASLNHFPPQVGEVFLAKPSQP